MLPTTSLLLVSASDKVGDLSLKLTGFLPCGHLVMAYDQLKFALGESLNMPWSICGLYCHWEAKYQVSQS